MSELQQRVEGEMRTALKAGDRERLSNLRLLLSDLRNEELRRAAALDEEAALSVVRRGIKQRLESALQFRQGGREDAAAKEEAEAEMLRVFLPPEIDEATLRDAAREQLVSSGLSGPAAMGPTIKALRQRFGAAADGATLNRVVREILAAQTS